ncbi:MAG: sugar phosphate isomerase/epimerase [Candidatus Omnitrophica bacterium]|nr:sugar phosphate isomerase/epimerase [Candidatus Omnitrophota bacterium]
MSAVKNRVYISTGAFGRVSVLEILKLCRERGWKGLELSSAALYDESMRPAVLKARKHLDFLVHNYFPTPEKPFVLNLASDDPETIRLSREHCQRAIELCAELESPFYSVHSGFCFHAAPRHLGHDQTGLERIPGEKALGIFQESLGILSDYAAPRGVGVLFENNVCAPFNLIDGKNELLLAVTPEEILAIATGVGRKNLGLLLDVAHLKVSATALGFDAAESLKALSGLIRGLHLSDNDGQADTNEPVRENSWFWTPLLKLLPRGAFWVLEAYCLPPDTITAQTGLIDSRRASA